MKNTGSRIVTGIMFLTLLCAPFVYGQDAAAPRIRFSEIRFDAGTVKEGAVVNHDFEFTNDGQVVLRIREVIPA